MEDAAAISQPSLLTGEAVRALSSTKNRTFTVFAKSGATWNSRSWSSRAYMLSKPLVNISGSDVSGSLESEMAWMESRVLSAKTLHTRGGRVSVRPVRSRQASHVSSRVRFLPLCACTCPC
eukprot:8232606-Pyramimonas_sp.AAC.1